MTQVEFNGNEEARGGHATATLRGILTPALILGWLAVSLSVVGDTLLDFVFIIGAARETKPLSIGVLGVLIGLPALLGSWVGSRIDRRPSSVDRILVGSMLLSAFVTVLLWLAWPTSFVAIGAYVGTFLLGVLGLVATTVWQSRVPELVKSDSPDDIKRVMGWTVTTFAVGTTVGPLAAAALAAGFGSRQLILLNAVSFLVGAALFVPAAARLRAQARTRSAQDATAPTRTRSTWTHGLALIFAQPLVRGPAIALALMNFVMFGASFGIPLLAVQRGMPDRVVAAAASVFVVGGIIGSAVGTYFRHDQMFVRYLVGEPALRAVGLVVVVVSHSAVGLLVGAALFTIPQGMGRVARLGFMATSFPASERASVFGAYQMLVRGLMPLAPLVMEGLVTVFGATKVFLGAAALLCGTSIVLASDKSLRRAARALAAGALADAEKPRTSAA